MKHFKTYLVGGAVRDKLLKLIPTELDWVVVGATPEDLQKLNYKKVGKDFPVFLHPTTHEEYALARLERKIGKGYYGFTCDFSQNVTLEEDLLRRDLTINAIAEDEHGKLIDPYGGIQDLERRVLRHVSSAFIEDPVRVLRVARFMARFKSYNFTIAPETLSLMKKMVLQGEVEALVPERVWQEMTKTLLEPCPSAFFETLHEVGALKSIWPELDKLWGVPQSAEHHPEIDTGVHVMMALNQSVKLGKVPQVHFAVLCHDLGKGCTPLHILPRHIGHENRGVAPVERFCNHYKVPHDYRNLAVKTAQFHLLSHKAFELKPATIYKLMKNLDAFRKPLQYEYYLMACEADARGRLGLEKRPYPQREFLKNALKAIKKIDMSHLLAENLSGEKIKIKIDKVRIKYITDFKNDYLKSS